MKPVVSNILVAAVLLTTAQLAANPNVVNVKGTQTILKPEYQQLGLAHGCLWWKLPICENLYRIAYEKNKMAEEVKAGTLKLTDEQLKALARTPVDDLVQELFHLNEDMINFIPAVSPQKMGSYLTPAVVGQFLGLLYQLEQKGEVWAGMCEQLIDEALDALMPGNYHALAKIQAQLRDLESSQTMILRELGGKLRSSDRNNLNQKKAVNNNEIQALKKQLNALPDARAFSTVLVKAHQLCQQKESGYLPETVYCLLLALVWGKANTREELQQYYRGLASSFGNEVFVQAIDWVVWTQNIFDMEQAEQALQEMSVDMPFEELVLATFAMQEVMSVFPPLIRYTTARYQGISFSDCGETMLRNLFNLLCWDVQEKRFDTSVFEGMKAGKPAEVVKKINQIMNFYESIKDFDPAFDSGQLHDAWSYIVSGLPGVVYKDGAKEKPLCNITAQGAPERGLKNIEKVIQVLTGCSDLEALSQYAKQMLTLDEIDRHASRWEVPFEYQSERFDGEDVVMDGKIKFFPAHFELFLEPLTITTPAQALGIVVSSFGQLACATSLNFTNAVADASVWRDITDIRQRRSSCLVGVWRSEVERSFVLGLLDKKDEWTPLILSAVARLVPDDHYAQTAFFHDLSNDMVQFLMTVAQSDAAKSALISTIVNKELHGQFKDWIDAILPTIQSIDARADIVTKMIEKGVHEQYKEWKIWIDTVLSTIESGEDRNDVITAMLRKRAYDHVKEWKAWIDEKLAALDEDEYEKSHFISVILETGAYGVFKEWVDMTLSTIQEYVIRRDLVIKMIETGLPGQFKSWFDARLVEMRDEAFEIADRSKELIITKMLEKGVHKEFKNWIDTTLPTIKDDSITYENISNIINRGVYGQFADVITQLVSTMQNQDMANRLRQNIAKAVDGQ